MLHLDSIPSLTKAYYRAIDSITMMSAQGVAVHGIDSSGQHVTETVYIEHRHRPPLLVALSLLGLELP